jgi:hypothetical protein
MLFRVNGFSNLFFSVSGSCLMMSIRVSESISMATFGIVLSSVILKIQYQKNRDVSRGVEHSAVLSQKFPQNFHLTPIFLKGIIYSVKGNFLSFHSYLDTLSEKTRVLKELQKQMAEDLSALKQLVLSKSFNEGI